MTTAILTVDEARRKLNLVESAIESLVNNKRKSQFQTGTTEFLRKYSYQGMTYEELIKERARLIGIIQTGENTAPTFRQGMNVSLVVTKVPV